MFSRIYHFLKGPNPLHPSVWAGRLPSLTFRRFSPQDLPRCLELYALNEPGRFPKGVLPQYESSLTRGSSYHLVTEEDGQVIASGGLSYYNRQDVVVLCFGLVHPNHQSRGIGTALLLARLALLKANGLSYHVFIGAVEPSFGFYCRFGFTHFQAWKDSQGDTHPTGHLLLTSAEIRRCRTLLVAHGIALPEDEDEIPLRTKAV
jgi:N-acetylglutamate synthase-like GNAT family acetyltransferase